QHHRRGDGHVPGLLRGRQGGDGRPDGRVADDGGGRLQRQDRHRGGGPAVVRAGGGGWRGQPVHRGRLRGALSRLRRLEGRGAGRPGLERGAAHHVAGGRRVDGQPLEQV